MDDRIASGLLVMRLTLALFFLQWGVEKLVVPEMTAGIAHYFYGIEVGVAAAYALGAGEILLAGLIALGLFKTLTYGAAMLIHGVTVAVTWRQLLDPWGDPVNHLFVASIPVLGALVALFLMRDHDRHGLARSERRSPAE